MLQNLPWQATGSLARAQLALFHGLGDTIGLTADDRCRALGLAPRTWAAWTDFLAEGPLPAEPALPDMLLRLGETNFHLSATAGRQATPD